MPVIGECSRNHKVQFPSTQQDRIDRKCYGYVFPFGMKTSELLVNVVLGQKTAC